MPRWEPEFDTFDRDGREISVDMAAAEHAPVDGLGRVARVLLAVRPDRLPPSRAEARAAEARVIRHMTEGNGGVHVGTVRDEDQVTLAFYLDGEGRTLDALMAGLEGMDPLAPRCAVDVDPGWSYYFDGLFPDEEQLQLLSNRKMIGEMRKRGDDPSLPRVVDHFAYFSSDEDAASAAAELARAGYQVDAPEREDSPEEHDETPWLLTFHRRDHLAESHADEFTCQALEIVTRHGGVYDGWGAPVTAAAT